MGQVTTDTGNVAAISDTVAGDAAMRLAGRDTTGNAGRIRPPEDSTEMQGNVSSAESAGVNAADTADEAPVVRRSRENPGCVGESHRRRWSRRHRWDGHWRRCGRDDDSSGRAVHRGGPGVRRGGSLGHVEHSRNTESLRPRQHEPVEGVDWRSGSGAAGKRERVTRRHETTNPPSSGFGGFYLPACPRLPAYLSSPFAIVCSCMLLVPS